MDEEPIEIPITDVFDLHSIRPRDAKAAVEAYLEEARARGFRAIRIIHGRGIGVQREMVRRVLSETPGIREFRDAPMEAGGWGATIATFGEAVEPPELSEFLVDLIGQHDANLAAVESLVAPLDEKQFHWRDQAGRWCIGECLDHLVITGESYNAKIARCVEQAKSRGLFGVGPFRYGPLESYFLRSLEPPANFRVKAPKEFRPQSNKNKQTVWEAYRLMNRGAVDGIRSAAGVDLRRAKVGSPVSNWIKFSLGIALASMPAHDRRHIYQMRELQRMNGFPS